MSGTIFFSWQSDLSSELYREFIKSSLQQSIKELNRSEAIVEGRVDEATENVPGWPEITSTILNKIDNACIFVADISLVGKTDSKHVPNPNVMYELGYALKALGRDHIICVVNKASLPDGKIESLPFDLRASRPITYKLSGEDNKLDVQKKLVDNLVHAIGLSLTDGTLGQIIRFLEETNPTIIELIKAGRSEIPVMFAQCRSAEMQKIKKLPNCGRYLHFKGTGSFSTNNTNRIGNHINDQAEGPLSSYVMYLCKDFHL